MNKTRALVAGINKASQVRQVGQQGREAGRQGGREAGRQGGREAGRQGGREAGRQGGRQAGRQAGRQGGRQTVNVNRYVCLPALTANVCGGH